MGNELIRVALADDHLVKRQALAHFLRSRGKFTVVAESADTRVIGSLIPSSAVDVIVLETRLPELPSIPNGIPILVMLAEDSDCEVQRALKLGARSVLSKNAPIAEFEEALERAARGESYVSPVLNELFTEQRSLRGQYEALTPREKEILAKIAEGLKNKDIAKHLFISPRTVDTHRTNILKKLEVRTNADLVRVAALHGLIQL